MGIELLCNVRFRSFGLPLVFALLGQGTATAGFKFGKAGGDWQHITVTPPISQTKGCPARVTDLGELERCVPTACIRTVAPGDRRGQYPRQSLENMPPETLPRLAIQAIRCGVRYEPSDSRQHGQFLSWLDEGFKATHENNVMAIVEIGAQSGPSPLRHL